MQAEGKKVIICIFKAICLFSVHKIMRHIENLLFKGMVILKPKAYNKASMVGCRVTKDPYTTNDTVWVLCVCQGARYPLKHLVLSIVLLAS